MNREPNLLSSSTPPPTRKELTRLAGLKCVQEAFEWFAAHEPELTDLQMKVTAIPAPPFHEQQRSAWMLEKFSEFGLLESHLDGIGNVIGQLPGLEAGPFVAVSAHIDTVFTETQIEVRRDGNRLIGPGVADNGAGLVALLALARAMRAAKLRTRLPLLLLANVGEEGEGDLRGMRHFFEDPRWQGRIASLLALDGAGTDTIVTEALGSRRFEVIARGPGGHSWSDFGTPNPILVLARAIQLFAQTPVSPTPKTTFNVGVIRGGTSVNSIPESASMRVDIRSTSMAEMERLEAALRLALDRAVEEESRAFEKRMPARRTSGLSCEVVAIGNRPAGELAPNARILQVIRAVDAQLGNAAQIHRASTDANVPLSLGREAIAIGGGGAGGGAHTLQEWFDCNGRELGLRRILLATLTLAGVG